MCLIATRCFAAAFCSAAAAAVFFVLVSVLVDMTKTAGDFRSAANKALEAVADGLLPRLRPILDEVGTVSALRRACVPMASLTMCMAFVISVKVPGMQHV